MSLKLNASHAHVHVEPQKTSVVLAHVHPNFLTFHTQVTSPLKSRRPRLRKITTRSSVDLHTETSTSRVLEICEWDHVQRGAVLKALRLPREEGREGENDNLPTTSRPWPNHRRIRCLPSNNRDRTSRPSLPLLQRQPRNYLTYSLTNGSESLQIPLLAFNLHIQCQTRRPRLLPTARILLFFRISPFLRMPSTQIPIRLTTVHHTQMATRT